MIWSPRAGEGIPRPLLKYLDNIERVNSVVCVRFFYDEIIRGIGVALGGKEKRGVIYVPGCMILLCHSLYGFELSNYELYLTYIDKYTVFCMEHLLIPLVRDDHWHLVEVDLKDKVVKHYSSAGHEAWMEPVNKIINYFDAYHVDFVEQNVRRIFRYEAIKCEQQKMAVSSNI
ncbi:uncharacterized protein LOC109824236 [Asparagus officinalis]|uniref:uncharacterized protein LOC109824236 n=1 Tax=Asparagus officinalis TaxID=4686 RepID=UPI00098E2698|nr:uncharacterized protein LOC109824236 [Asparagus officinalis]